MAAVNPQLVPLLRGPQSPANDIAGATPERQIMDFLVGHRGRPFCDHCLTQQVHHANHAQIAIAVKAIGAAFGFRKVTEPCTCCGKALVGIKAR